LCLGIARAFARALGDTPDPVGRATPRVVETNVQHDQ
jgi:hypothetical protein